MVYYDYIIFPLQHIDFPEFNNYLIYLFSTIKSFPQSSS